MVSTSQVSQYNYLDLFFISPLKQIDWMPSVKQVRGTLPTVFREKIYTIINGSEVFIETPSDLALHLSTWSK